MKKPSIYDIAERVHVSSATVSYVLNGKEGKVSTATKKKIYAAMKELGYTRDHAAVSLSTGKSHLIGVCFPLDEASDAFSNPFYGEFLGAFESVIQTSGYDVIIGQAKNPKQFEKWYISRALDGVVVLGSLPPELEKSLVRLGAKAVLVDVYEDYSAPFPNIRINDEAGEYLATRFLLERGHTHLGYIGGPDGSTVNHRRYCGFEKAMMERELPIEKNLVFHTTTNFEGGYAMGDSIAKNLDRISALVVDADIIAIGLIRRLQELGTKLPEDLSVVGFDDIHPAQYIHPTLTTVRQDIREKGSLSAKTILEEIDSPSKRKKTVVIEPTLAERNSVSTPSSLRKPFLE